MPPHPENKPRITPMPTAPTVPPEESPRLLVVLIPHQHPDPMILRAIPPATASRRSKERSDLATASALVFLPDDGEKEGAGRIHDCNVGQLPVAVVRD